MPTNAELARALADPEPPTPGEDARAAVARRSKVIVRRRRLVQGTSALACVAALGIGVAAVADVASGPRHDVRAATTPPDTRSSTARLSVATGSAIPSGVELDIVLVGDAGTYDAHVRTPGTIVLDAVAPGDYELRWSWASDDGTATAAGRVPVHVDRDDLTLTL